MRVVHVHEARAKSFARLRFDVMGHDRACGSAFGPEPDEWHLRDAVGEHALAQKLLVKIVDREVDGPLGKWQLLPAAKIHALKVAAHGDGENFANRVVAQARDLLRQGLLAGAIRAAGAALRANAVDQVRRIKREWLLAGIGLPHGHFRQWLVQGRRWSLARDLSETSGVGKAEKPRSPIAVGIGEREPRGVGNPKIFRELFVHFRDLVKRICYRDSNWPSKIGRRANLCVYKGLRRCD